jgi:2-dehydro-3-deoxygluconokinase
MLNIKPADLCKWDLVSLGEVMLRFDPGEDRIDSARNFRVWEGGGEYNVARSIASNFGKRAAIITALADNPIGRLVESLMIQGSVDVSQVIWKASDGIGKSCRNGIYFMERGFGARPPTGCSDRSHTAISQMREGQVSWPAMMKDTRWFHTGGIFAGLSDSTADVAREAMIAARTAGAIVSYDLNYRHSLWQDRGGMEAASEVNAYLLPYADVIFGFEGFNSALSTYSPGSADDASAQMFSRFPQAILVTSILRDVISASEHSLSAIAASDEGLIKASEMLNLRVFDRVGSGDSFAGGVIYGLLEGKGVSKALEYGLASCSLSLASPGDGSSAKLSDIESTVKRSTAYAVR